MSPAPGVLHVDREAYRVYVGLEEKHLRLRQFTILCYLIENSGRACRYHEIALACDIMGRESVKTTVSELRRVLGQMEGSRIVTVKKYGYRIDVGSDPGTAAADRTTCHDRPPAPGRGAAGIVRRRIPLQTGHTPTLTGQLHPVSKPGPEPEASMAPVVEAVTFALFVGFVVGVLTGVVYMWRRG